MRRKTQISQFPWQEDRGERITFISPLREEIRFVLCCSKTKENPSNDNCGSLPKILSNLFVIWWWAIYRCLLEWSEMPPDSKCFYLCTDSSSFGYGVQDGTHTTATESPLVKTKKHCRVRFPCNWSQCVTARAWGSK